jgi:hypothetical protein
MDEMVFVAALAARGLGALAAAFVTGGVIASSAAFNASLAESAPETALRGRPRAAVGFGDGLAGVRATTGSPIVALHNNANRAGYQVYCAVQHKFAWHSLKRDYPAA